MLAPAPVAPYVSGRGIPAVGLLAHMLVSKFGDHLPVYQHERLYARDGLVMTESTLDAVVGIYGVRLHRCSTLARGGSEPRRSACGQCALISSS
ncbi:IS66 family transposase [Ralstonia chuxiongensis]|uniref:IS66 family transposase n=1 Tax=Ralstonia chuxiongensis TaxID=2957504 RepID=UPI0028F4E3A5|nr:hypothetical protein R8510_05266 [Ralstonia chuxiongensis]